MTYFIAHRGLSARFPENSMQAFEAAVSAADVVELDVRATSDCQLVCIHDATLERTHGDARRVGQLTWAELHELAPEIPRLEDVLGAWGHEVGWFIDCKVARPRAIEAVHRAVEGLGLSWDTGQQLRAGEPIPGGACVFEHRSADVLQAFRSATGAGCVELVSGQSAGSELVLTAPFITAYAQGVVLPDRLATPRLLSLLRVLRLGTYVYTVNDGERISQLAEAGASAVFTDDASIHAVPG